MLRFSKFEGLNGCKSNMPGPLFLRSELLTSFSFPFLHMMVSPCISIKIFPVKNFAVHFTFLPNNSQSHLLFSTNQCSLSSSTVSYLVNTCGLSPESALSISKNLHFKTLAKPESVLTLLRKCGFTKTQIADLVRKRPRLLLADPQKSLLPKLDFLQSIGVSNTHIARNLSRDPTFLARSLENRIIPSYYFLKSVLQSNAKIVSSWSRTSRILFEDHTKYLGPNIACLRQFGVDESCLVLLLTHFPEALIRKPEEFRDVVIEVFELGFDPLKTAFVLAIHVLSGKDNKSIRDRCWKLYKKWGWSDDEIHLAFRKHPNCMILSENKITRAIELLVNKMGWRSSEIARCPTVLFLSLEKRIIPRCSVIQVLLSKGLVEKDHVRLTTLLVPREAYFLEKFVTKYEEEVPRLLDFYQGKVNVSEL